MAADALTRARRRAHPYTVIPDASAPCFAAFGMNRLDHLTADMSVLRALIDAAINPQGIEDSTLENGPAHSAVLPRAIDQRVLL